jgi:alpha-L-rhamnosidase
MLRREFEVPEKVIRATAYVSGLGLFEFYLNGVKVGDHVLEPALTDYDKRVFYVTFDVTSLLQKGVAAAGVVLGNGRYFAPRMTVPTDTRTFGYPKVLLQIRIECEGGTATEVVSDQSWRVTTDGPIRANNEYDGERYDARKEMAGWNRAGFDDSGWENAQLVTPPKGHLAGQMIEPIRVTETIRPVAVTNPQPGVFIYDMGQNMVGWCRLTVSGPRGIEVALRHSEALREDGTLYLDNIRSANVTDTYILKGHGVEVYEPRFTYHGFRYVEIKGFPGTPGLEALQGKIVHDAVGKAGDFSCSSPVLNQIYRNVVWGVRGNYRSIPTDCPQRDERQGWLGDRSAESRGETYLFDVAALYGKWLADMEDAQLETGSVPDVAPAFWPIYSNNVTWPSSTIIIPGGLYDQYADLRILEKHYGSMKKWIDFMSGFIKGDLMPRDTYGDWCVPPEAQELIHSQDPRRKTAGELIGTAYFCHDLRLMARYATLLGKAEDVKKYNDKAEVMMHAFNQRFFHPDTHLYDNGSQTSSVLPLAFGIVPEGEQQAVFDRLVEKIMGEGQGHIGTGLIGGQWLMQVLSDNGRADVAYALASQKTYPSWGYMIEKGATTIWELWNGDTAAPAMNSHNHVMLVGDLITWLYEYLAGIGPDPGLPGFKHVLMRPHVEAGLQSARATHQSPYGLIASNWKMQNGRFSWDVTVPPNTTATLWVPAKDVAEVTESRKQATRATGVRFLRVESGSAVFEVVSGRYSFAVSTNTPAWPAATTKQGVRL